MLLAIVVFALVFAATLLLPLLFMYGGRDADDEAGATGKKRTLLFGALTPALANMFPRRPAVTERYSRWLRQAGHYHAQALQEFLALRHVLVVGTVLTTAAVLVAVSEPGDAAMYWIGIPGVILSILAYALPPLFLEARATARKERIESSLPDAMDMITMCTSAGLPLQHSISRVSDELRTTHPDLAYELRLVERQTSAGSLTSAMQQFAKRIDAPEIHSVASMVWQAQQQGASVAGAFHTFADQVRTNRRQRAEEAGNKAAFKLLFPLVFCLAPAVYLILIGPAVLNLRDFVLREKQPGGALSASAQNMESMLSETHGTPAIEGAFTGQTSPRGYVSPSAAPAATAPTPPLPAARTATTPLVPGP